MLLCIQCNSWFNNQQELNVHKSRKECAKIIRERSEAKKVVRAQQDAERKAKLEGSPKAVEKKESVKEAKVITTPAPEKEIETKVDSAEAEGTSTSEEVTDDNQVAVFDADAFKTYLVEHCDVKIQKVSRMKEDKLKTTFEDQLQAFEASLDN